MKGLGLALFLAAAFGLPGAAKPLAEFMPRGAVALLETENLAVALRMWRFSRWHLEVQRSPQFQTFARGKDYQWWLAGRKVVETAMGMDTWTAAERLLGGKGAVGFYPGANGGEPVAVVVLRVRDAATLGTLHGRLGLYLRFSGSGLRKGTLPGGVETWDVNGQFHVARRGDWLVVSRDRRLMTRTAGMLNVGGNPARSVAGSEGYKMYRAQMGNWHLANLFVDLRELARTEGERLGISRKMEDGVVSFLLHGMAEMAAQSPYAGLTLDMGRAGFVLTAGVAGNAAEMDDGFGWFFSRRRARGAPDVPRVPGMIAGATIHRDLAGWYGQREALLAKVALAELHRMADALRVLHPGQVLERDVLPALGKTFTVVTARQDFKHLRGRPEQPLPAFAVVVDSKDAPASGRLLRRMFETLALAVQQEQQQGRPFQPQLLEAVHRGVRIRYTKVVEDDNTNQAKLLPTVYNHQPAMAVVKDRFVLANSAVMARAMVDGILDGKPDLGRGNRNFHLETQPAELARMLRDNHWEWLVEMMRRGGARDQANWETATLLKALDSLRSLRLGTMVGREDFQMKLEGRWN